MIIITEHEREIIGAKFPKTHIVRTMKSRSKRHRYYMEEDDFAVRLLRSLRNPAVRRNNSLTGGV